MRIEHVPPNIELGVTASRKGISSHQANSFRGFLRINFIPIIFHNGCCVGGDEKTLKIVLGMYPDTKIYYHPPLNKTLVFKYETRKIDVVFPEKDYLDRNKCIVDSCKHLVCFPELNNETQRSGTWSTIRYARKVRRNHTIFYPDGSVEHVHGNIGLSMIYKNSLSF